MNKLFASSVQKFINTLLSISPGIVLVGLWLVDTIEAHAAELMVFNQGSTMSQPHHTLDKAEATPAFLATASEPLAQLSPQFDSSLIGPLQLAQNITEAVDGTGTIVNQTNNIFDITGGTRAGDNLFHSFEQFSLDAGQVANILSAPNIKNILGRVIGGDPSFINGLLQSTGGSSDLYLINPSGILFGPDIQLNLPGSIGSVTANGVQFEEGILEAVGSVDYTQLDSAPTGFLFSAEAPGAIVNRGNLEVLPEESIQLIGGQVLSTGTLTAPGGNITIAAVPGQKNVHINEPGMLLSLALEMPPENIPVEMAAFNPMSLPELLTGGHTEFATGLEILPDGSTALVGSELTIPDKNGVAAVTGILNVDSSTFEANGSVNIDAVMLTAGFIEADNGSVFVRTDEDVFLENISALNSDAEAGISLISENGSILVGQGVYGGAGGLYIEAAKQFRVLGSTVVEYEALEIIDLYFPEEATQQIRSRVDELGASFAFIEIPISIAVEAGPITIIHGGIKDIIDNESGIVIKGLGTYSDIQFVVGPQQEESISVVDPEGSSFGLPLLAPLAPLLVGSESFPDNSSGTVGTILRGGLFNRNYISSIHNLPYIVPVESQSLPITDELPNGPGNSDMLGTRGIPGITLPPPMEIRVEITSLENLVDSTAQTDKLSKYQGAEEVLTVELTESTCIPQTVDSADAEDSFSDDPELLAIYSEAGSAEIDPELASTEAGCQLD